jgi:hypothetical protein
MDKTKTTAFSGCLIWFLLISLIGSCVMPVAFMVGGISSASDFAIKLTGGYICPEDTTPESFSYATTTTDEFGNSQPSTAYELHCVDAGGTVVKKDPIAYAFIWIGIIALAGVLVTAVLSFVFAVPGGMLVTKILDKFKSPRAPQNLID